LERVAAWPALAAAAAAVLQIADRPSSTLMHGSECQVSGRLLEQPLRNFSGLAQRYALLGECADHDAVAIRIPERKLFCSCGGVHVRLLVESGYKSADPLECQIEIIDAEKEK